MGKNRPPLRRQARLPATPDPTSSRTTRWRCCAGRMRWGYKAGACLATIEHAVLSHLYLAPRDVAAGRSNITSGVRPWHSPGLTALRAIPCCRVRFLRQPEPADDVHCEIPEL